MITFIKFHIDFFDDTKIKIIKKLPSGPDIVLVWIHLLLLGMKSGRPGVIQVGDGIPFQLNQLANHLDVALDLLKMALSTFEKFKMIEYLEDNTIYITNFEKHQNLHKIEEANQKNKERVAKFREKKKLIAGKNGNAYSNITKTLPEPLSNDNVMVQTKTKTKTKTQTETKTQRKTRIKNGIQEKIYNFDKVYLSDSELQKLKDSFGEKPTFQMIDRLNNYILGYKGGNKYKNHYRVLLNWFSRENKTGGKFKTESEKYKGLLNG